MSQTLRLPEILEIARETGKVAVEDLAAHFGVTVQTIRRDLSELADLDNPGRWNGCSGKGLPEDPARRDPGPQATPASGVVVLPR